MRELIKSLILLAADALEADTVVLYIENDNEILEPYQYFSVQPEVRFWSVSADDSGILRAVLEKWPPVYVTSDEKLISSALPYEKEPSPKSFMAVPFKVGRRRAILCADSVSMYSFDEKRQRVAEDIVGVVKQVFGYEGRFRRVLISEGKLKFLEKLLVLMLGDGPLGERFTSWCELIGVDVGIFFIKQAGEITPFLVYSGAINLPAEITVGPRSMVYIALERGESYVFVDAPNEPFDGFTSYGAVIPVEFGVNKGCLFLGASDKGFFSRNLEDIFRIAARIIGYVVFSEIGERETIFVLSPLELKTQLRIMCNRVSRENSKLSVGLFRFSNYSKLRDKIGFWKLEEKVNNLIESLLETVYPRQVLWARLGDSCFVGVKYCGDEREEREFKSKLRAELEKRLNGEKLDFSFISYPEDVDDYDELCSKIEKFVHRSGRRLFG